MDLSIVIPVLNEAANIGPLIPRIEKLLETQSISYEILVIDGGSTDGTREVAEAASPRVRVIRQHLSGYGGAIAEGLSEAKGEYIVTMDADLSHDPLFLLDFWNARNQSAVVIGSRYIKGGKAEMPAFRLMLSRILNAFFGRGLSMAIRDLSSGFRLYSSRDVKKLPVKSRDFDILQEILLLSYSSGQKIKEIPIHYKPRHSGGSHAKLFKFGVAYLKTFFRMWRLRNSIQSADYDDRAYDSIIPLQRYWQRRRYSIVNEFSPHGRLTLDVGCGSTRILASEIEPIGLEIQLNKLRYARRFGRPLVNGTIWSLPFRDQTFDCVICSEVIEHIESGEKPFLEMRRVLKRGGTLVIGTPDYAHRTWRWIEALYKIAVPGGYADEHITQYTYESLSKFLQNLGFQVKKHAYIFNSEMILQCSLEKG